MEEKKEKNILFIAENDQNFLIRAMIKSLTDAGYKVLYSVPEVYQMNILENRPHFPDLFIIYLEGSENKYDRFFSYMKKLVSEQGTHRHLFLIGNPVEINTAYKVIPQNLVAHAFQRPVSTEDLLRQLHMVSLEYRYEEKHTADVIEVDENRHTILLVDDDDTQLHAMQRWFSKRFNAFAEHSGMDTVAFLKEHAVDLILLDYEMPGLSGVDVFQMLRAEPSTAKIPIVFLTGTDDRKTVMSILSVKPDGYLLKSMPPAILVQKVEDFFVKIGKKTPAKKAAHTTAPYDVDFVEDLEPVEELETLEEASSDDVTKLFL